LYPLFPDGYENQAATSNSTTFGTTEGTDHPLLFDVFNPYNNPASSSYSSSITTYNRRFPPAALERLYRFGDTGYSTLPSDLERLSFENFNNYNFKNPGAYPVATTAWDGTAQGTGKSSKRRWLVTTNSADRIAPGVTPYIWDPTLSGYGYSGATPDYTQAPTGGSLPYGSPTQQPLTYGTAPATAPTTGEYASDFRATGLFNWPGKTGDFTWQWPSAAQLQTALSRINLNRRLTPYPLYDTALGFTPNWTNPQSGNTYNKVFTTAGDLAAAAEALADRQKFADDIYRRLLLVTGVPPPAIPATPTDAELAPRRWLAQLAVNIVDFIDEDDIMTPFNFYNNQDVAAGGLNINALGTPPTNAGAPPATELPLYWVIGTELPKVVLSEVSIQCENADATDTTQTTPAPPYHVGAWVELYNSVTTTPPVRTSDSQPQAPGTPHDGYPIPLLAGDGVTAPYQVVIAGGLYANATTASNGNPLGTYNFLKVSTQAADFQNTNPVTNTYVKNAGTVTYGTQAAASITTKGSTPPANNVTASLNAPYIDITGATNTPYFILAPKFPVGTNAALFRDFLTQTAPGSTVPSGTPFIQSANLQYSPTGTNSTFTQGTGTPPPDERGTGLTVLLRRLANPHMPFQGDPTLANWNPYVTVDYMEKVPVLGQNLTTTPFQSRGKQEPFAGATQISGTNTAQSPVQHVGSISMTQEQNLADTNTSVVWNHTFGQVNSSGVPVSQYDWLVHLDRQVVSPLELLHVSSYPPFQLTQRFVDISTGAQITFGQRAPWFDETRRLYRIFEFMDAANRGAGVAPSGRAPGKININTIWDIETFRALCDQNGSSWIGTNYGAADVDTIYNNMMSNTSTGVQNGRTPFAPSGFTNPKTSPALPREFDASAFTGTLPTGYPTTPDHPFLGLATGQTTGAAGTQFPNNRGIDDTLLRTSANTGVPGRLFQDPGDLTVTPPHPYLQYQLLTKMFNNVTTRSNVFAVWVTVGFFEVTDPTTTPPTLGTEIGKSEGRNIRHRMFAIVDRTNLAAIQTSLNSGSSISVTDPDTNGGQGFNRLTLSTIMPTSGTDSRTGKSWSLQTGLTLSVEPGTDNEENVVVLSDGTNLVGEFRKSHTPPSGGSVPVIVRGNPGPWVRYDPRQDPGVVIHWNIIN
jgi:hypothetical protein